VNTPKTAYIYKQHSRTEAAFTGD